MSGTVLIQTFIGDYHAAAVSWGLDRLEIPHYTWFQSFFPVDQSVTTRLSNHSKASLSVSSYMDYKGTTLDDVRVFWHRRRAKLSHHENLHEADKAYADDECKRYLWGVRDLVSKNAFLVNDPRVAERANSKLYQLSIATDIGLTIPDTLATNDADELRAFYEEHQGGVIIKPFQANAWFNKETEKAYFSYTSQVKPDLLENRLSIQSSPCLYQRMVHKSHEVRVLWMGRSYIAVSIDSQAHERTQSDWRLGQHKLTYERITLPTDVEEKCQTFMEKTGLATGSFDFMVDLDGNYVFLEINESGQFLFYEDEKSEIPVLDAFVAFLEDGTADFKYREGQTNKLMLQQFSDSPECAAFMKQREDARYQRQTALPCTE